MTAGTSERVSVMASRDRAEASGGPLGSAGVYLSLPEKLNPNSQAGLTIGGWVTGGTVNLASAERDLGRIRGCFLDQSGAGCVMPHKERAGT